MKYTKGKMWAAVIGAAANVAAAAVVASQDGKFTNDEITGIITVFVAGAGTAYAVWKTRNNLVERSGNAADQGE